MLLLALSVALALGVSFICSLMEAALLSLRPSQVADITHRQPKIGVIWQKFKSNIEHPIGVILIINTAAHTIGATVAGAEFDKLFGDQWIWVFSLIFTIVMVQFTEILPKTLGVRFNQIIAAISARPLNAAVWALSPLLKIIHWINAPFQVKRRGDACGEPTTVEEISALAGLARLSQQIGDRQEKIIKGSSRLSGLTAAQIMLPIEQMSMLSTSQTITDALIFAHIDAHTRFPICEAGDKNKIIGYVNFKEMVYFMRTNPNDASLRGVIRPILSVESQTPIPTLLEMLVQQYGHIAIVRNQGGETLGMVTLEDIMEELLGDIQDEFDRVPKTIQPMSEGTWIVGGGAAMNEIAQKTGLNLDSTGESLTAWLKNRLGRTPAPGDVYREATAEFTVRRTRRNKAFDVSITREKTRG